ncbi:MAG: DnaJ domain-containing protein, partial [Desulfobacterales bacterium]
MMKIILSFLALLYALNPYDILPDFWVGGGWIDDLIILGLVWHYFFRMRKKSGRYYRYFEDKRQTNARQNRQSRTQENGFQQQTRFREEESTAWDPYRILGVTENASLEEIKRAHRQLATKYHPDKVEHLGEEFKALAEKRFKEIQQAYQELTEK